MSDGIKRFYKEATAIQIEDGHGLALDGLTYKTPAKNAFVVPTQAMAEAVATEWNAAGDKIFPDQMPHTTHANTALDRVAPQRADVCKELTGYAGTELLCYRAADPAALVDKQRAEWDPWLDWARNTHGLHFKQTQGVIHVAQPPQTLEKAAALLAPLSDFELAAVFTLITVTGSFTLGMALHGGHLTVEEAFQLAHLDELYQTDVWGADEDAEARRAIIRETLAKVAEFLTFCH